MLITGAASGIGRAATLQFASEGGKVSFCGRRENLGREVEHEIKTRGGEGTYIRADVRNESDVKPFVDQTVQQYGRLDMASNNAGRIRQLASRCKAPDNCAPRIRETGLRVESCTRFDVALCITVTGEFFFCLRLLAANSTGTHAEKKFTGGMSPSMLRRSIEFMETRLEGNFATE